MGTRPRSITAAAVVALALVGCSSQPDLKTATPTPTESSSRLADGFAAALTQYSIPGGAIAVRRDGVTRVHAAGKADDSGAPVTADTVFGYRSISKSFVVTVILQMAEDGSLDLDAPAPGTGLSTPATVRQLAAMRSGVPNYTEQPAVGTLIDADPTREWDNAELLALVAGLPADFAPNTAYEYSNTNTVLLGETAASLSGTTWDKAVHDRIVVKLGLRSVVYPDNGPLPAKAATAYEVGADGVVEKADLVKPSLYSAAGGLYGDVNDLALWAEALGSGSLLSPAMQKQRLDAFAPIADDPASPVYDEYGLGIGRLGRWIGHTGNAVGSQALAMYDPESGTAVAIVLNATGDDPDRPAHLLQQLENDVLAP